MEQIVVKTEVQPSGDILLFYVDESNNEVGQGTSAQVLHTQQQYFQDDVLIHSDKYVIQDIDEISNTDSNFSAYNLDDNWLEEDIKKLLIFYIDNKEAFINEVTQRRHLWTVACKTMLHGKNHVLCEMKHKMLLQTYTQMLQEQQRGVNITWPYFDLCKDAFQNEVVVVNQDIEQPVEQPPPTNVEGDMPVKKQPFTHVMDEKVHYMLALYLKHKAKFQKDESQRGLWELITLQLGEQDVDFWHRRFLNYKQHYIRLLHKQNDSGPQSINWPYMDMFNQIYKNDDEFLRRYALKFDDTSDRNENAEGEDDGKTPATNAWFDLQNTFLVKYCYDCFHEFQDPTIPDDFLWHEVARLLDKEAEDCKKQYNKLKTEHITELIEGVYDITNRKPVDIVLDNIISKETEIELEKQPKKSELQALKSEKVEELVQYYYDNTEMLKDPVCRNVCLTAVAKKLKRNIHICKKEWDELTEMYKSLLCEKRENPEMQIDWRYIDLFDRIFGYGIDIDILDKLDEDTNKMETETSDEIGVKKVTVNYTEILDESGTDEDEIYDERGFTKRSKKRSRDAKALKILEFYLKHKYKFSSTQYKKIELWETLSKQIGLPANECAHRFKKFKQIYKGYVKRELSKPERPILWPYYPLCKKVFGYRSIKAKLKNEIKNGSGDEDWSPKEIKALISYFARNFDELKDNIEDKSKWTAVAADIGRSENVCKDKFLELRKSYRKLKTLKSHNSDVKVSWKYFNMMDVIYASDEGVNLEDVEDGMEIDEEHQIYTEENIKQELQDDDYTIIVIPEGEDLSDTADGKLHYEDDDSQESVRVTIDQPEQINPEDHKTVEEVTKNLPKWTKRSKKRLIIFYLNYLRANKGKVINSKDMWTDIATKFGDRKPVTCKKMFIKLRNRHKESLSADDTAAATPYSRLFSKILSLKPKFARTKKTGEGRVYKDYPLDDAKTELALKYYLQNIDEFASPKFEKRYLWTELANHISEPVTQVFNKVNYLIQFYKSNTLEAENTRFGEILKEIFIKENLLNDVPNELKQTDEEVECTWTDEETDILLTWYLAHLEKFKNPKFVRSYLWMEASDILKKSPWACSNKMSEIRTQYRTMVKENPEGLNGWRFYSLCQRIYGTGKKNIPNPT